MAYQSRASWVRHRHHFSALWTLILHRRVVFLTFITFIPKASKLVILSAAGAKDLLALAPGANDVMSVEDGNVQGRWRPGVDGLAQAGPSRARVPRARSG